MTKPDWTEGDIKAILAAYPPRGVPRPLAAKAAIEHVLFALLDQQRPDPKAYLLERVRAYAKSPLGRSIYAGEMGRWLYEGGYDADPVAWERGDDQKKPDPGAGITVTAEGAEAHRRVMAKKKAEGW